MDDQLLILAAEDCPPNEFEKLHIFLTHEERVIKALCAHGPVLVKGGRGCGKSALMIEAHRRIKVNKDTLMVMGVYLSLRHIPLLRSKGQEYEKLLCELLSREISRSLIHYDHTDINFSVATDVTTLQLQLKELSDQTQKRIVLMFDDVAHIGRETSLEEFFGIFRTISSNFISCKASIYPGVTRFGIRFDIYNDATIFDLSRDERSNGYQDFFDKVLLARFPTLYNRLETEKNIPPRDVASFIGRTVVGNMRGFVIACGKLQSHEQKGLVGIETTLKEMASDYYWPLLEELEPKLGIYQPLVATSKTLAETIFKHAASQNKSTTVIIHKDIIQKLSKTFEILEYVGFISKRETSRAMRSGGRGPRFSLNLSTLLEIIQPSRLTREIFNEWQNPSPEQPSDIHISSGIINIEQPKPIIDEDLKVFQLPVEKLLKSDAYPYGLTQTKVDELIHAEYSTIGQVADASDQELLKINGIGEKWLERIRSVVGQAVWM
ncbi:hypothetical protein [Leptothrix ochracea]|uniref:hypothetical protein n=1 Tax=Leptothrix ochracea TaxID=735331 RepID=UPI0034E21392